MKTSALAAQLFEPATVQTGKPGAGAGAAEFAQVLAKARQVGFAPTLPEDGNALMAKVSTRRSEPAPRTERPAENQPRSEPRRTEHEEPQSESTDQASSAPAEPAETQAAAEPAAAAGSSAADDSAEPVVADDTAVPDAVAATTSPIQAAANTTTDAAATPAAVAADADAAGSQDGGAEQQVATDDATTDDGKVAAETTLAASARQSARAAQPSRQDGTQQPETQQATATPATTDTAASQAAAVQAAGIRSGAAQGSPLGSGAQRQAAELAGLAGGVGVTVRSAPTAGPQTDLVAGGALMAQSVDGDSAIEAALLNGDATDQFLMGGDQAGGSLAGMLNRLEQTAASTLAAGKSFAAEAGVQGTGATGSAAAQPVAGLGAASATGTANAATTAQATAPAHAAQQPTPVQQVSSALANAVAKGQDSISIQLTPDEMGKIDITLDFSGDKVSATIVADKPETLDMLQKDSRTLERMLSDAGLQTDQQSLNFSLRGGNGNAQAGRDDRAGRSRAQLLAIDDGADAAPALPQARARTTVGGIDISV